MRAVSLERLGAKAGERLLDVGCGPAYYLADLPRLEYFGFDTDSTYIAHARARFGDRGTFFDEPFTEEKARELGPFDGVLLMGLLHHLDDDSCHRLLSTLATSLKPGGRVIALDTTVHDGQNFAEHLLAVKDRGEYVRRPEAFRALAEVHFSEVRGDLAGGPWIPSIYWIMELRVPRAGGPAA